MSRLDGYCILCHIILTKIVKYTAILLAVLYVLIEVPMPLTLSEVVVHTRIYMS